MSPRSRELFAAFEAMIGSFGPYYLAPAKTRIAFLGRVRFAGVTAVTPDSITVTFALPRHLRSNRFVRVDEVVPGWFVHRLVITDRSQLDPEVRRWFRQSYEELGMQGRLKGARR